VASIVDRNNDIATPDYDAGENLTPVNIPGGRTVQDGPKTVLCGRRQVFFFVRTSPA